jgi:CubicO group peptidase (beta-lactamase class C family)
VPRPVRRLTAPLFASPAAGRDRSPAPVSGAIDRPLWDVRPPAAPRYPATMPAHDLDPVALDRAYAVAARRVQDGTLPFVILGVANAGGVIRLEAATAPDQPRRIGTDAVCLLASITKPIVATATMRLVQEGRFGLAVPLVTWLPELAGGGRDAITAWHVLTHTSGLDDGTLEQLLRGGMDRAELQARTFAQPLAAPVGSRYRYATFTFDLLAEALERALGEPLETILHETVLGPLGMVDTGFDPGPGRSGRQAPVTIGEWDGTRLVGSDDPAVAGAMRDRFTSLRLAGGGLWSTAHDLLQLGRAMLRRGELDGQRVLAPAFVDLATREVTVDGLGRVEDRLLDEHYAIGWGKPGAAHPGSPRSFGHGGASGTRLWIEPEHDLVIVYLSGAWGLPGEVIDETIGAVYASVRQEVDRLR